MKNWRPDEWHKLLLEETKKIPPNGDMPIALLLFAEAGADAMLEALRGEACKHPIFLKNCKSQRRKPAKICIDCPFKMLLEEAKE